MVAIDDNNETKKIAYPKRVKKLKGLSQTKQQKKLLHTEFIQRTISYQHASYFLNFTTSRSALLLKH